MQRHNAKANLVTSSLFVSRLIVLFCVLSNIGLVKSNPMLGYFFQNFVNMLQRGWLQLPKYLLKLVTFLLKNAVKFKLKMKIQSNEDSRILLETSSYPFLFHI